MTNDPARRQLAEKVREACIQAVLEGHEQAGMAGLCHEGAFECAVDAMRRLDIEALVEEAGARPGGS